MQCKQAHEYAHIKCNQSKVHELAPPTCVLLLSKNFDPSLFYNVAPFLSRSMSYLYFFVSISLKAFICLYNLSPFSSIFIKGVLIIDAKVFLWGRWLRLESCIFLWTSLECWNDTTCSPWDTTHRIFDLNTNLWDTSPYVIAWVIHLINMSSCRWGMHSSFDDHLKLRVTCGTIFLHDWYHV